MRTYYRAYTKPLAYTSKMNPQRLFNILFIYLQGREGGTREERERENKKRKERWQYLVPATTKG